MRLKDKVAIITGAGHGMGEAEARLFAEEGAKVMVADILGGEAERVAAEIRNAGCEAGAAKIDVTSEPQWKALIAKTLQTYGRLDILVNNAGSRAARSAIPTVWAGGTGSSRSTRRASFSAPGSPPKRWRRHQSDRSSTSARSWGLSAAPAVIRSIMRQRAPFGSIPRPPPR